MLSKVASKGLGFGLASGVITTLGLLVGVSVSTGSKIATIGSILTIAVTDALSDAFGVHISEESQKGISHSNVWGATFSTLLFKLLFALTFVLPVTTFSLNTAVLVSIAWGFSLLGIYSFHLAKLRHTSSKKVILEHWFVGVLVVLAAYLVGRLVSTLR